MESLREEDSASDTAAKLYEAIQQVLDSTAEVGPVETRLAAVERCANAYAAVKFGIRAR